MHKNKKKRLLDLGVVLLILLLGFMIFRIQHPSGERHDPVKQKASYRASYHFTVPDHWMNDPQRPIYFEGSYHFFYLYNKDYPKGNGTEWRHATSKDLFHWRDQGVAIPKYTNKNSDPWSGSVVRDTKNTAGLGKNSLIAVLTQQPKGQNQQQYLWYSKNQGRSFKPYGEAPVLPNPGTKNFRDPKIIWDNVRGKWVMVLAEGAKIGFYESADLKSWHYMSGFETTGIGTLECPDLYPMRADDGTVKWVLGASANGKASGLPNTYAYWTGSFDGTAFHADKMEPQWLDHGFDWYAAVTFEDGKAADKLKHRYAMAWMNNWDYPNQTPTMKDGFNGLESVVRQIRLAKRAGGYTLLSRPAASLEKKMHVVKKIDRIDLSGKKTLAFKGTAYQLDLDLTWGKAQNVGLQLRESKNQKRHIDVGVFAKGHYLYVNRKTTGQPDLSGKDVENQVPLFESQKKIHLKILVDATSIEVFTGDGKTVISDQVFPHLSDDQISLYAEGGTAQFSSIDIRTIEQQE
ncbi:MAG: glycoside hydrolase family 32 protein [Sporolactobacillus sp.]